MLHLSIARAIASDIQFIRQSCRRSMSGLSGQFKNVRFSNRPVWVHPGHHDEDRTPTHGYAKSSEAAMAAFAKSWRRE